MTASDAQPTAFGDVAPPAPPAAALAPTAGFVRLPRAVLRAPGLSARAKLLYALLLDYARQDGHCFPGTDRLRADLGCGHNQLGRAIRELEAGGLVARRRRGFGRPTLYSLLPLPGTPAPGTPPAPPPTPPSPTTPRLRVRRSLPALSVDALQPPAVAPTRPDPAAQTDPVRVPQTAPLRVAQDLDAEDHDTVDQQQRHAPDGAATGTRSQRAGVVARLIEQGITPAVARALAARHAPAVLERQLACHRHRVATGAVAHNPAGALVRAIRQDWAPPPTWVAAQERAAARVRQAEEAARQQEAEAARSRAWELKPPEERIAGRLQFWVLGQRAKRREPTAAEIAARRAELLAELAAQDRDPTRRASPGAMA